MPDWMGNGRSGGTMRAGWGLQGNPKYFVITGWIFQAYGGDVKAALRRQQRTRPIEAIIETDLGLKFDHAGTGT